MRSPHEIAFRLKQEARNLQLLINPPSLGASGHHQLDRLPAAGPVIDRLKNSVFADDILRLADKIVAHCFPLFGSMLETGPQIEWRRDYRNGKTTEAKYFRLVPYLDVTRAGDHKNIWELNRHQHLVVLAQAFLFSGRAEYLDSLFDQLKSWWQQNPFQRGMNWTSALEVAFRAFSWIWIDHFVGSEMPVSLRSQFLESLYRHGLHVENNLSVYFSPNTHLLGEAVVLHALGRLYPMFPEAARWKELGDGTVIEQMRRQVHEDGSHFEHSTYYHVYALDMFLFHAIVSEPDPSYLETLTTMADFLHSMMGAERTLPALGDDDGGRFFHPYGRRDQFGRATLATAATYMQCDKWTFEEGDLYPQAAWWLGRMEGSTQGSNEPQLFHDIGLAIFQDDHARVIVDCGPFGPGRAGHSHSDSLSLIASANGKQILIDPGTYTYVGDEQWRNRFRSSSAHNTIRIAGRDQAQLMGPFWWDRKPSVEVVSWEEDMVKACCIYDGFVHWRIVRFVGASIVLILDQLTGPLGDHDVEQFWHLASDEAKRHLFLGSEADETEGGDSTGWISPVFGEKYPAPCLVVRRRAAMPMLFAAALDLTGRGTFTIQEHAEGAVYQWRDGEAQQRFELFTHSELPQATART